MIPTPRLAVALAASAVGLIALGTPIGAVLLAVTLAGYLTDVVRLRTAPEVARRVPSVAQRMYAVPLEIDADGPSGSVLIRQPSVPDLEIADQYATSRLRTHFRARRRGRHLLPPATVRSVGPLGLATRQLEACGTAEITVYPDVVGAKRIARAVATGAFSDPGLRRRGPVGIGTEFESIRDYTPDDDIRHVNWRATLRTGRPMTNTYRMDRDRDVICVIDSGRLMTAPIDQSTRLDAAVDATAAIAHTADALGDKCGVVAFADRVIRSMTPTRRGAEAVVEGIHDLEPLAVESNYEVAFRAVGRSKRALVVLFTDLFEESAAMPLVEALPILSRNHAVIVAYVRDDDLRTAITDPTDEPHAAYRTVVALDALEARRRAVQRLQHRGVVVVEAGAADLPSAAVRAYLDLKQRAVV